MTTTPATMILSNYQNGGFNCTLYSDGTFVKESFVANPIAAFPSTIDIKITNYCDLGCAYCHEDSTIQGLHSNLSLLLEQLSVLPAGIELAIGGGNPLAHPSLLEFLYAVQEQGKYANITINQGHLVAYQGLIEELLTQKLIKGVGISVTGFAHLPEWLLKAAGNNLVLHMIVGIHTKAQLQYMLELTPNAKILLLGYKSEVGRGVTYYGRTVEKNIQDWVVYIRSFFGKCVLSFDNLAIEQLRLQRFFSSTAWSRFYMGDDFTSSMYIDAVKQQYAPTSRSLEEHRVNYTNLLQYWEQTHGSFIQET